MNLRAQNLNLFLQLGDGVDDATWLHHLRRGDYSRWFRDVIRDEELAAEASRVELDTRARHDGDPRGDSCGGGATVHALGVIRQRSLARRCCKALVRLAHDLAKQPCDRPGVDSFVDAKGVLVPAFDVDEALGSARRLEQPPSMRVGDHPVVRGVQEQLGHVDGRDSIERRKPLSRDERDGEEGKSSCPSSTTEVKAPSTIRPAAGTRDASSIATPLPSEWPKMTRRSGGTPSVRVRYSYDAVASSYSPDSSGRSGALAEPAIVERQEIDPEVADERVVLRTLPVADVPQIAVADEQPHVRRGSAAAAGTIHAESVTPSVDG